MRPSFALAAVLLSTVALPAAASGQLATGGGGLSASAWVDMRITVPSMLQMALLGHPASLRITAEDVKNGEVVVTGARASIIANSPLGYYIQAELVGPFVEATIEGLPAPVRLTAQAVNRVLMPTMVGHPRPQPYPVSYRLRLANGTTPGEYAWPIALSLETP